METWKSVHDALLDQTLALAKAAIDHDARPMGLATGLLEGRSSMPMSGDDLPVRNITSMGQDRLVEDTLSLIEYVSRGATIAIRRKWQIERLRLTDDVSRMASDLDALKRQVTAFNEMQRRSHGEREKDPPVKAAAQRGSPNPRKQ
jgi:hypothetical protein